MLADRIIDIHKTLNYKGELPVGLEGMNPYIENTDTMVVIGKFY